MKASQMLLAKSRWRGWELLFIVAALASPALLPSHAMMINEIAITALFALSLDLILGYTGIVSLGHAAFFGFGAYSAALFAKHLVPDPLVVAAGMGIPVNRVFLLTFAVGSGLAGLGGALGAEVLSIDPTFPLKYMIYFLIVVAVGGTSSITGPLLAALLLGVADVAGKYYIPKLGGFIVYSLMIAILLWRPQGLFSRGSKT